MASPHHPMEIKHHPLRTPSIHSCSPLLNHYSRQSVYGALVCAFNPLLGRLTTKPPPPPHGRPRRNGILGNSNRAWNITTINWTRGGIGVEGGTKALPTHTTSWGNPWPTNLSRATLHPRLLVRLFFSSWPSPLGPPAAPLQLWPMQLHRLLKWPRRK